MPAQKKSFNFLSTDSFEKTRLGIFLKWSLSFGRWIVVGTELIVILAFLSRFSFDRRLTDLREDIRQKQVIIDSFAGLENRFLKIKERVEVLKEIEANQSKSKILLSELDEARPLDVIPLFLSFDDSRVNMECKAFSEAGLRKFLNEIKSNKRFSEINMRDVSQGGEKNPGIRFNLSMKFDGTQ